MKAKQLSIEIFQYAETLFRTHNWDIDKRFDNFCKRQALLDKKHQLFLISLTEDFYKESLSSLVDDIRTAYIDLGESFLKNSENIIFIPLVSPTKDVNGLTRPKTKSGELIYQLFKNIYCPWLYYNEKFIFCDIISEIKRYYKENSILIFIDDFVGSGKTAVDTINEIKDFCQTSKGISLKNSNIAVIALAMMYTGKCKLDQEGIKCGKNKLFHKGITENQRILKTFEDSIALMHDIERIVVPKSEKEYSFGYMQSESLIFIMDKSPNNTFPVYWYGDAPVFPRDRNKM